MRLGHQPITDRGDALLGYRLVLSAEHHRAADWDRQIDATSGELLTLLASLGPDAQIGDKLLAVPVGPLALASPALDELRPQALVLHWPAGVPIDDAAAALLDARRRQGYRIWFGGAVPESLSQAADWVSVQDRAPSTGAAEPSRPPVTGRRVVATDADSAALVREAWARGANTFVGYHFLHSPAAGARRVLPSYATALKALGLVEREAPVNEIETALERDPALSFRLLRFMNTAAMTGLRRIEGLRDAVSMLGYRRLARWLALVLVTADVESPRQSLLARTAIVRARTMEMLAEAGATSLERDPAFLVGLFSLLDALLGVPLAHLVDELDLADDLASALSDRVGPLGQYLSLVEACEDPALTRQASLCDALQVEPLVLAAAQIGAMALSESLAAG